MGQRLLPLESLLWRQAYFKVAQGDFWGSINKGVTKEPRHSEEKVFAKNRYTVITRRRATSVEGHPFSFRGWFLEELLLLV